MGLGDIIMRLKSGKLSWTEFQAFFNTRNGDEAERLVRILVTVEFSMFNTTAFGYARLPRMPREHVMLVVRTFCCFAYLVRMFSSRVWCARLDLYASYGALVSVQLRVSFGRVCTAALR